MGTVISDAAGTAAAVTATSRPVPAQDPNRPAGDRNPRLAPVTIPGLNPDLSRDLLAGTALPAVVKQKATDLLIHGSIRGGRDRASVSSFHLCLRRDDFLTGEGGGAILVKNGIGYTDDNKQGREERNVLC